MARQKTVYPRDMVAHLWANASQDEARDPSGNMYFNGPTLYSYGSHYVIGYRFQDGDGGAFYIMNADSNSNTTNKMRYIAQRALPGFRSAYWLEDLRGDTFSGQGWRGRLMRAALSQAGALFENAAQVSRVSAKRDGHVSSACERMRAAQAIANAVLAVKGSRADDRKAARETLRSIAAVPAFDNTADNATQKAAATAAAALLVRDEMRAKMADYAKRANGYADDVQNADNARFHRSIAWRMQQAQQAATCCDHARDLARRYRFKCPALPDAAAMVAALEPEMRAHTLAELQRDARGELEHAETVYRERDSGAAWTWRTDRAANIIADHAAQARRMDAPETVPAWMAERAEYLRQRGRRAESVNSAARVMDTAASQIASGDSYAAAGHARDAVREYRNAERSLSGLALPAGHPLALRLDTMTQDRARVSEWIANADAHIRQQNADTIAAWRAGGAALPWTLRDVGPLLRLSSDRSRIETSWGAQVPASVAPMLWRAVNAARDGKAQEMTERMRGQTLGHFALETVKPDGGLIVGCHDIAFSELEYIAAALGYIDNSTAAA